MRAAAAEPALAEASRRAHRGRRVRSLPPTMTFGPGAVERFRELKQDLSPLAQAWLRAESVEEHMGYARHRMAVEAWALTFGVYAPAGLC